MLGGRWAGRSSRWRGWRGSGPIIGARQVNRHWHSTNAQCWPRWRWVETRSRTGALAPPGHSSGTADNRRAPPACPQAPPPPLPPLTLPPPAWRHQSCQHMDRVAVGSSRQQPRAQQSGRRSGPPAPAAQRPRSPSRSASGPARRTCHPPSPCRVQQAPPVTEQVDPTRTRPVRPAAAVGRSQRVVELVDPIKLFPCAQVMCTSHVAG